MGTATRVGVRSNAAQLTLLVFVNALVGGVLGSERATLPLLATDVFHLVGFAAALAPIVAFGLARAVSGVVAGALSDRLGRKPILVTGWLVAVPVPAMILLGPDWNWVVVANALLGVNQGLTWSTTAIMRLDLAGPGRRGPTPGLHEAAGYGVLAATALASGAIAAQYGLRPTPFLLAAAYTALGLGLATVWVKETRVDEADPDHHFWRAFGQVTWREPALASASQIGLVSNLHDGLAWGLFPLLFAAEGASLLEIGVLAALYPGAWGLAQLVTGPLGDRLRPKPFIVVGIVAQAAALGIVALGASASVWAGALILLGVGTALVSSALLAVVGHAADASWRGSAQGVHRLWRDCGFVAGALAAGYVADRAGIRAATGAIAGITAASALWAAYRRYDPRGDD